MPLLIPLQSASSYFKGYIDFILVKLMSKVQAISHKLYDSVSEDCGESLIRSSRSEMFCRITVLFCSVLSCCRVAVMKYLAIFTEKHIT